MYVRKIFKQIFVLMLVVTVIMGNVAYAGALDKYDIEEDFKYSDEMIGNALKTAVPRIYNTFDCTVKYPKISLDTRKIYNFAMRYYNATQYEILDYISKNITDYMVVSEETLSDVFVMSGSGVTISDDGYIATNQHVISTYGEDIKSEFLNSGYIEADAEEFVNQLVSYFGSDQSGEEELKNLYISEIKQSIEVSVTNNSIKVVYPDADGNTSLEAGVKYDAQIIKEGKVGDVMNNDVGVEDAAILKIDAQNMVSLSLENDYPSETTKIFAAGFPGASNSIFEAANSTADTIAVTITNGIVSRLVPLDNSSYKMIQTTATVNHGNSGGPSVDETLNVSGLNTLANSEAEGYYWMVPAAVIRDKAQDLSVKRGKATELFMLGLQAMQGNYGATAKECFEEIRSIQPNTPYINKLIERASALPQNSMRNKNMIIWIASGAAAILILVLIIVIVSKSKKKKRAVPYGMRPPMPTNPPSYMPPRPSMPYNMPNPTPDIRPAPPETQIRSTMPIKNSESNSAIHSTMPLSAHEENKDTSEKKTVSWERGSSEL